MPVHTPGAAFPAAVGREQRDGSSRRVIGWAIDEHLRTDLVEPALSMAVAMRGELADEVTLHADCDCRYTSAQIAAFTHQHNLARSVGRTDVCWDSQVPSHAHGAIARSWGGLILTVSFVEIWGRSDPVSHHGGNEAVLTLQPNPSGPH